MSIIEPSRSSTSSTEKLDELHDAHGPPQSDSEPSPELNKEKDLEKNNNSAESADDKNAFLVKFDASDDPKNYNPWYKAWLTAQMSALAFLGSMGSSITAPAEPVVAEYVGVSLEVSVLMLSLFVLGYAFGPMIWAPISEVYGRKVSMLPAVFIMGVFSIGTATSRNAAAVFLTRFFGGLFGSAPISNVSAALGDIYLPRTRGVAMTFLAMAVVGGPCVAPIIGAGILVNPNLGWRWTEYMQAIMTFAVVVVAFFFMPETYPPVLLKWKAQRMRKTTGDDRWWHPHEAEKMRLSNIFTKYLSRPLRMFFTEPLVTCIACYASFVYGLLFLQLEVYPLVFQGERGWGTVTSTLPFLGLFVGVLFAILINFGNQPSYKRAVDKNGGLAVPEARLPPMILGGVLFSTGIFWFGWTATPSVSWISPVFAAGFIGAGFNIVFQQCLNFLVDCYGPYAASAISANTFLRSLAASGLPMVARPMFLNMGIGQASSVLGGISCLALPIPFIFMKYCTALRAKSKFAPPPKQSQTK